LSFPPSGPPPPIHLSHVPLHRTRATTAREQVTELLLQLRQGDEAAMDRLFPLVYDELLRIAH